MKSMPLAVSGINSRIILSRTHAPVALKACLVLPLRRAIATIFSARPRRSSSKFWKVSQDAEASALTNGVRL
jgi:hypothetical protein